MVLVRIEAGEFMMGSRDSDKHFELNEKPRHRVRITRPFYLGKYVVTQAEYKAVTGRNPSFFKGQPKNPVESVSWFDAVRFCNQLSEREGLKPFYKMKPFYKFWIWGETVQVADWNGTGYRLPTEAEWEYACRAGTTTRFCFGDDDHGLGEFAWFDNNAGDGTHEVGQKRPNAFGLYDMHGNVWEWCWDWYSADYYKESPVDDPRGPSQAKHRVIRGGGWNSSRHKVRSAIRASYSRDDWQLRPGLPRGQPGLPRGPIPVWRLSFESGSGWKRSRSWRAGPAERQSRGAEPSRPETERPAERLDVEGR